MGCLVDELSIGHLVPCGSVSGHFLCWHTGDSETLDLIGSPCITCLLHHTLELPLHALVSRTLATLAEVRDRVLWRRERLDHDLVVRVLDCCDCHGCLALTLLIYTVMGCCATIVDTSRGGQLGHADEQEECQHDHHVPCFSTNEIRHTD